MNNRIIGFNLLLAAGLASSYAFADPLQQACPCGVFKRGEAESKEHPLPLPAVQKLEQLVNKNSFKIRDLRDNNPFVYQVYAACPTSGPAALKDLGEDFPDDGTTLVAAVDLTGSGVSDLIYARKDWGGWKVLSNGSRLPKPFQGFVAGLYEKGQESAKSETIPADTRDMLVDTNLLAVVGDFLGNGTEQLAYTRPGWTQMYVVGCHGVTQMAADLTGIQPNGPGARVHWLFPFKAPGKGIHHTRIGYYRMGAEELPTFAPKGMAFKRSQVPLNTANWDKLSQKILAWPVMKAPGGLEQRVEEGKEALAKAAGLEK
jgi:hypothetical protein